MAKNTRLDFTTTPERKEWLKTTAERQEISVSQLLNRLIRNRMLQEQKHKKNKPSEQQEEHPVRILSKAEIIAKLEEDDEKDEEEPFNAF